MKSRMMGAGRTYSMFRRIVSFVRRSAPARAEGQGLVEYGLILTGVSIAAVVALFALSPRITSLFNTVSASIRSS